MGESLVRSAGDGGCAMSDRRRNANRIDALRRLFGLVACGIVAGTMVACGGGGQGASPSPSPTPSPSPSPSPSPMPIPAQLSVPNPAGYDADHLSAFNRINELRFAAGLGMLVQNANLDRAAQAHANWQVANGQITHVEALGTRGFTGAHWWDRASFVGYAVSGGGEVISSGMQPTVGVDSLMNAIYHREILLSVDPVDVGIGWAAVANSAVRYPLVVNISSPLKDGVRGLGQQAQSQIGGLVLWPLDGAIDVATHMGNEAPDPVPGVEVGELGTPISVSVDKESLLEVASFVLAESSTGVAVPTFLLTKNSDPNGLVAQSFVGLIPIEGLKIETKYSVEFRGSVVSAGETLGVPCARNWSFTTGSLAYPQ